MSEAASREDPRSRGDRRSGRRTLLEFSALVAGVALVVAGWWFTRPYWIAKYRGPRAYLRGAVLIHAPLRYANLSGADLQDANLTGADLQRDIVDPGTSAPDSLE